MSMNALVTIDEAGSLVLPEGILREMDLAAGDTLVARCEGNYLVLEKPSGVLKWLKARFAGLPPGVSLANELIAERRAAAKKEAR